MLCYTYYYGIWVKSRSMVGIETRDLKGHGNCVEEPCNLGTLKAACQLSQPWSEIELHCGRHMTHIGTSTSYPLACALG